MAAYGPLLGFLARTNGFSSIQVPLLRKARRTKAHAQDAGGLLMIAFGAIERFGQLGAHRGITPVSLVRPLSIDALRLDQWMSRLDLTQCLSFSEAPHDCLSSAGIEANKPG
jgi:hypothetical protein